MSLHDPTLPDKPKPNYHDYEFRCINCKTQFDRNEGGMKWHLVEFCPECVETKSHFKFIAAHVDHDEKEIEISKSELEVI